ncbi:MAG: TetR/AcrR family transcriptional regulator [Nakamurella sp.]
MPRIPLAERRAQLLDAAWAVMTRSGLAAATTRATCAEAGVSQGVFHYCFDSRDDMLREIAVRLVPMQITAADAAIADASDVAVAVEQALLAYWDLVEADLGAHQVLYEITVAALRSDDSHEIARLQYHRYLDGARDVLDTVAATLGVRWHRPVDVLARQVVTIVDGLTLHYIVDLDSAAARAALSAFAADLAAVAVPSAAASDVDTSKGAKNV